MALSLLLAMVRRTADGFEITQRMLALVVAMITIFSVVLSIGASYAGTRFAIERKADKDSFQSHVTLGEQRYVVFQNAMAQISADNKRQDSLIAQIGSRLLGLNCLQAKYPVGLCDDVVRHRRETP